MPHTSISDSFTSPPAGPSTRGNRWPHCQDSPHSRTDCLTPLDPRSSCLTFRSLSRAAGSCAVPAPPHQPLPAAAAPHHPCRGRGQRAERRASADSGQRPALRGGGADTLEDNGVTRRKSGTRELRSSWGAWVLAAMETASSALAQYRLGPPLPAAGSALPGSPREGSNSFPTPGALSLTTSCGSPVSRVRDSWRLGSLFGRRPNRPVLHPLPAAVLPRPTPLLLCGAFSLQIRLLAGPPKYCAWPTSLHPSLGCHHLAGGHC